MKNTQLSLTAALLLLANVLFAQSNFFKTLNASEFSIATGPTKSLRKTSFVRLDEAALRNYLRDAPLEFQRNAATVPLTLEIPLPDGKTETFGIFESPILSPEIAALHPDIKTYAGNSLTNGQTIIRFSLTSEGFDAILLNVGDDMVYFQKYKGSQPNVYFSYFGKDAIVPATGLQRSPCGVRTFGDLQESAPVPSAPSQSNMAGTLHTFRLAFAANGEFTQHHGGTQASGFAAVVGYVNRMEAVYRNELSVHFMLVSGTNLIYTNPATDPYTNVEIDMLAENQTNVDMVIGSANYDVAHVVGWDANYGSGGGIASFESVCDNSIKAEGASVEGDETSYSQLFFDQLVFHEVGHQFGMKHSYNSNIPVCTTRNQPTSAEPGSGATIMSYGFTCGTDDYLLGQTQTGPILHFHAVNYSQASAFIATSCGANAATTNTAPTVTVPGDYTIPKSTPFALTGSATDPDALDVLTYCWEGTNIGEVAVPTPATLTDPTKPPFFRSYPAATLAATRTYPILDSILNNLNVAKGDKLPSVSFATTHRLTVRDNNSLGGNVSFGTVTVTVDGSIGPFLENTNLSGNYGVLSSQTITWSVNGTNVATPNVQILLSADGGLTFPYTLAASTANDGSEVVVLPNVETTTARIKVAAVGNIFFDISNSNFTISNCVSNMVIANTAIPDGTYRSLGDLTAFNDTVASTNTVTFTSDTGVALTQNFETMLGGVFEILIQGCTP